MGPENVEEFSRALEGEAALAPWPEQEAAKLTGVTGGEVATALGGLEDPLNCGAEPSPYS